MHSDCKRFKREQGGVILFLGRFALPGAKRIASAIVPLMGLILLAVLAVSVFCRDVGSGASQMFLLFAIAFGAWEGGVGVWAIYFADKIEGDQDD